MGCMAASRQLLEDYKPLAGLAVAPDGSLLITEDANGVIYRVSYKAASR